MNNRSFFDSSVIGSPLKPYYLVLAKDAYYGVAQADRKPKRRHIEVTSVKFENQFGSHTECKLTDSATGLRTVDVLRCGQDWANMMRNAQRILSKPLSDGSDKKISQPKVCEHCRREVTKLVPVDRDLFLVHCDEYPYGWSHEPVWKHVCSACVRG